MTNSMGFLVPLGIGVAIGGSLLLLVIKALPMIFVVLGIALIVYGLSRSQDEELPENEEQ